MLYSVVDDDDASGREATAQREATAALGIEDEADDEQDSESDQNQR